jgi:hypothetical protein
MRRDTTTPEQTASKSKAGPATFDDFSKGAGQSQRYDKTQIRNFADEVLNVGYCILPSHFSTETMQIWRQAFEKLLQERIENGTASGRGPNRYYVSLPFVEPFADPVIYENPDILAILELLAGADFVMPELATDTPLKDSDYQVIHRDFTLHSPYMPEADPAQPFQFAVNFPLVKVTAENGPFEIIPGTHLLTDEEAKKRIQEGEAEKQLIPLLMEAGDVMIRDVRALHRGTPNRTDQPRTMVVVGYNRSEHLRPQLKINIPRDTYDKLSARARHLLRLNPVVTSLEEADNTEEYSNLYFL